MKVHIHHHRSRMNISYPVSLSHKLYALIWAPLLSIIVLFVALKLFTNTSFALTLQNSGYSITALSSALLYTSLRLIIAYILSVVTALPLALLAVKNKYSETIFLPLFDILQSIPVLAFFPILIIFFLRYHALAGASIFILYLTMLWSLIFTMIGGLKIIPSDIKNAAQIFGLKGMSYFRKVIVPSIFPEFVTGSILAVAAGWNVVIVAEALHTYIPGGTSADDLFGIGSIMVKAATEGKNDLFIVALTFMVLAIAFLNFFVWQKLLHYSSKFRFE